MFIDSIPQYRIREFAKKDSENVFSLVSDIVGKEFNIKIDLDGLDSDLLHLREYYNKEDGGCFWVLKLRITTR